MTDRSTLTALDDVTGCTVTRLGLGRGHPRPGASSGGRGSKAYADNAEEILGDLGYRVLYLIEEEQDRIVLVQLGRDCA